MATTKGPTPLTQKQFIGEVGKRLEGQVEAISKIVSADEPNLDKLAKIVVDTFTDEVISCITNGYKVTLNGFGRFEPRFVAAKKKGEMVRNVATGQMQPRAQGEPASFKAVSFMSSSVKAQFPSITTKAGKQLIEMLDTSNGSNATARKAPAKKAAPAKGKAQKGK